MELLSRRRPARKATRVPTVLALLASWVLSVTAPDTLQAQTAEAASAASGMASAPAAPRHKPLRENRDPTPPAPTEPQVFKGDPGAPALAVAPRKQALALYPCSQCHKVLPLNTTPRKLVAAPHAAALPHGQGRMWCLDCHVGTDRDWLHTLRNPKVDFNDSHLVCASCHSARHRDWSFGAHGKRVAGWQPGEREIYNCTHCHDPHNPTIAPRKPSKPPPLRAGLEPMQTVPHTTPKPWQRAQGGQPVLQGQSHVQTQQR